MLFGEALTPQQRSKFDLAVLTLFVERQKMHGFSRESRESDMSEAVTMAAMYINELELAYGMEVHEGGGQ